METEIKFFEEEPFEPYGRFFFELYMYLPEEKPIPQAHKWGEYATVESAIAAVNRYAENGHDGVPKSSFSKVHFCLRRIGSDYGGGVSPVFCATVTH